LRAPAGFSVDREQSADGLQRVGTDILELIGNDAFDNAYSITSVASGRLVELHRDWTVVETLDRSLRLGQDGAPPKRLGFPRAQAIKVKGENDHPSGDVGRANDVFGNWAERNRSAPTLRIAMIAAR